MAGYRRVNYYELCRLCTSSEGAKMHIFREEGRKRQLPTKIQICLPVQVCEDDSLPKIICNQCVEKLENFYDFRESCVNAESMLESYFTSFRYSDDFSREGKVYVKEDSSSKKKLEVEATSKDNSKETGMGAQDGLSSLVQAAGIQIVNEEDGTRVQQYKCAMQMQGGTSGGSVLESTSAASEARYSYETCGTSSSRLSDASPNAASVETPPAKLEDGSTQCNETDFKNNGIVRNQGSAESSNEGDVTAHNQQQLQSVAFSSAVPGQEMLLHFSFKQDREAALRSEEQSALQRSSIAQIGEFLRMKSASVGDNGVQSPVMEAPTSDHHCMHCGKMFNTLSELNNHHPCGQESPGDNVSDKSNLGNTSISCDVCNKLFKRKEHLFQHRKLHTGERPYVCGSCGKAFSRKEHLVRHTVSHTGQKIHACEMCGKSFSRKDNLHKHRKTHGIAGQFHCDSCGKSFVVKHNYMMHKSNRGCSGNDGCASSLATPHPNRCDMCNKVFSSKHYLNIHKQRHRNKAAKMNSASSENSGVASDPLSMPSVDSPPPGVPEGAEGAPHQPLSCEALGPGAAVNDGAANEAGSSSSHNMQTSPSQPPHAQQPEQLQQPEDAPQQPQDEAGPQSRGIVGGSQQGMQLDPLALTHGGPLGAPLAPPLGSSLAGPLPASLTGPLGGPLAALPSSPLLAPGLLQHVNAGGVAVSGANPSMANPTMAIHVSTAATAYLCTPPNDLLETYRRLHST